MGVRKEKRTYDLLNAPFMPHLIAFEDHETNPILIIEDLSSHHWPPPWSEDRIARVIDTVHTLHSWDISGLDLGAFGAIHGELRGWSDVAAEPAQLLATGLVDEAWLDEALPILLSASERCETEGAALTHCDLRSDNLCIAPDQVLFVDWNWACRWSPRLDLGFFLNFLTAEGGPPQETHLTDSGAESAVVSGFFARQAGLPEIPGAPQVRWLQGVQLKSALSWAARILELPSPMPT